jgi:hypothetical protein
VQMHYYAFSLGFDRAEDVQGEREQEGSARSVSSRIPNPSSEGGRRTRERLVLPRQSAIETTAVSLDNTDSRNYKKRTMTQVRTNESTKVKSTKLITIAKQNRNS